VYQLRVSIEIETFDKELEMDLFDAKRFVAGETEKTISEGISIRWEGTEFKKVVGFPDIIHITLILARDVALPIALGIVSNWLYDKIKGRAIKIKVKGFQVQIDRDQIEKILTEKIERTA